MWALAKLFHLGMPLHAKDPKSCDVFIWLFDGTAPEGKMPSAYIFLRIAYDAKYGVSCIELL